MTGKLLAPAIALAAVAALAHCSRPRAGQAAIPRPTPAPTPMPAPEAPAPPIPEAVVNPAQALYDQAEHAPPAGLLDLWKNASDRDRPPLLEALRTSLANVGSARNAALEQQLAAFLEDNAFAPAMRADLADALAESNSLAGVRALLDAVPSATGDLRQALLDALARAGRGDLADPARYALLSTPMEIALAATAADDPLAQALATGLAGMGSPAGVRAAFDQFDRQPDAALAGALSHITNPDAADYLAGVLRDAEPGGQRCYLAGAALVNIGTAGSVQPVLDWLSAAPSSAEDLAAAWFRNLRTAEAQSTVASYLAHGRFSDPAIGAILRRLLDANRG